MHKNNELYICRVCGLEQLEPQWGEDGESPTYNICECCGVEFGYEDSTLIGIRKYRDNWIKLGAKWNSQKDRPKEWSLDKQLLNIPKNYI